MTAMRGPPPRSRSGRRRVPEYTRPATWEDVKTLAQYFEEAAVEYAIIGGYALAVHGLARFTEDIDVLVDPAVANSRRWIVALSRLPDGAARELAAQPDVFAGQQRYAIRVNDDITVDVLPAAAGHSWDELKQHIVDRDIDGVRVKVLDLEGLLKTKEVPRPKDQADAEAIRRALELLRRK
jgi:predicted nucleotidyltransferase